MIGHIVCKLEAEPIRIHNYDAEMSETINIFGLLYSAQTPNSSVCLDLLFLRMFLPCTVSCTWRWVDPAAFLAVQV